MASACDCGRVIEQPARGRPRKKCAVCSPVNRRRPPASLAPVAAFPPAPPAPLAPLVRATMAELEAAGRADSADGLVAVLLAEHLSRFTGTPSGLAALAKQFDASKTRALEGAGGAEDDPLEGMFDAESG